MATTLFLRVEPEECEWISGHLARFVRHLVLHEIAHALGIMDEGEADRWTAPELRKLEGERDLTELFARFDAGRMTR